MAESSAARDLLSFYRHAFWHESNHAFWTGMFVALLIALGSWFFPSIERVEQIGFDMQTYIQAELRSAWGSGAGWVSPDYAFLSVREVDCEMFLEQADADEADCDASRSFPMPVLLSIAERLAALEPDLAPKVVIFDLALPPGLFAADSQALLQDCLARADCPAESRAEANGLSALRAALCAAPMPVIIDAKASRGSQNGQYRVPDWADGAGGRMLCPSGKVHRAGVHILTDPHLRDGVFRRVPFAPHAENRDWLLPDAALLAALYANERNFQENQCFVASRFPNSIAGGTGFAKDCVPDLNDVLRKTVEEAMAYEMTPGPDAIVNFYLPPVRPQQTMHLPPDTQDLDTPNRVRLRTFSNPLFGTANYVDVFPSDPDTASQESLLKNTVLIIGSRESSSGDWHLTPLGTLPGPMVLLNAVHSFANAKETTDILTKHTSGDFSTNLLKLGAKLLGKVPYVVVAAAAFALLVVPIMDIRDRARQSLAESGLLYRTARFGMDVVTLTLVTVPVLFAVFAVFLTNLSVPFLTGLKVEFFVPVTVVVAEGFLGKFQEIALAHQAPTAARSVEPPSGIRATAPWTVIKVRSKATVWAKRALRRHSLPRRWIAPDKQKTA